MGTVARLLGQWLYTPGADGCAMCQALRLGRQIKCSFVSPHCDASRGVVLAVAMSAAQTLHLSFLSILMISYSLKAMSSSF